MPWITYLCLAPLGWLVVQDFRTRSISVPWLAVFAAATLICSGCSEGWRTAILQAAGNLALLLLLYGGVWLYLRVRYGPLSSPFRKHIGWGDAWFLMALTPAFGLRTFLWFLTLSLTATLLFDLLYRRMSKRRTTIPLVSALGIAFMLHTLIFR